MPAHDWKLSLLSGGGTTPKVVAQTKASFLQESPTGRLVATMKAQGRPDSYVLKELSLSEDELKQIKIQPWYKERLNAELADGSRSSVESLLRGAAVDALSTLAIEATTAGKASDRIAASKELLDRFMGKAPMSKRQPVWESMSDSDLPDDAAAKGRILNDQIAMLSKSLERLETKEA